jgi:hypothetical protein
MLKKHFGQVEERLPFMPKHFGHSAKKILRHLEHVWHSLVMKMQKLPKFCDYQ